MNPLRPALMTSYRFMPNPSPTTETCKRDRENLRVLRPNGFPNVSPRLSPRASASGGEAQGVSENASSRMNRILAVMKSRAPRSPRADPRSQLNCPAPRSWTMRSTILLMLLLPTIAWAQNPVSDALRDTLASRAKNTIAAAEAMPAEKYKFKPTDAQQPFEHWVSHAAQANYFLCSKLTDATAPELGVKEGDPKDKLIAALKQSFDYCSTQLPKLQD